MGVVGLTFLLFPAQIVGFFTNDAEVIAIGTMPLRMVGLIQPLLAAHHDLCRRPARRGRHALADDRHRRQHLAGPAAAGLSLCPGLGLGVAGRLGRHGPRPVAARAAQLPALPRRALEDDQGLKRIPCAHDRAVCPRPVASLAFQVFSAECGPGPGEQTAMRASGAQTRRSIPPRLSYRSGLNRTHKTPHRLHELAGRGAVGVDAVLDGIALPQLVGQAEEGVGRQLDQPPHQAGQPRPLDGQGKELVEILDLALFLGRGEAQHRPLPGRGVDVVQRALDVAVLAGVLAQLGAGIGLVEKGVGIGRLAGVVQGQRLEIVVQRCRPAGPACWSSAARCPPRG